jgi:hypothetical protein
MIKMIVPVMTIVTATLSNTVAQTPNLTAAQINQRSINNAGGSKLLDSLNGIEAIILTVTPKQDSLSIALKSTGSYLYFESALGNNGADSTIVYNRNIAAVSHNEITTAITDPFVLEELRLKSYVSRDYGYKKLGYKLERVADQQYTGIDLYVLNVTSPLGRSTLNYYDKRTNNLTMIAHADGRKTIFTAYHKEKGRSYPSEFLVVDSLNNITSSKVMQLNYSQSIDSNWFAIPPAGEHVLPDKFQTGHFRYFQINEGTSIVRDSLVQIEESAESNIEYKVRWESRNRYLLYDVKDASSLPVIHDIKFINVKVTHWMKNFYYCHFITSAFVGGTCVFEKLQ